MASKILTKEFISRSLVEAAMIIFSVLLALYLDQAITDRREARDVNLLVGHITDEINTNLEIVEKWLPYHEQVIVNINQYIASEELKAKLITKNGIDYFQLMDKGVLQDFYSVSAWELAQQNQVTSKLEFSLTRKISNGYYSQAYVDGTLQRLFDFILSREALDAEQLDHSLILLRNLMQELVGQENFLLRTYEQALLELEKR